MFIIPHLPTHSNTHTHTPTPTCASSSSALLALPRSPSTSRPSAARPIRTATNSSLSRPLCPRSAPSSSSATLPTPLATARSSFNASLSRITMPIADFLSTTVSLMLFSNSRNRALSFFSRLVASNKDPSKPSFAAVTSAKSRRSDTTASFSFFNCACKDIAPSWAMLKVPSRSERRFFRSWACSRSVESAASVSLLVRVRVSICRGGRGGWKVEVEGRRGGGGGVEGWVEG